MTPQPFCSPKVVPQSGAPRRRSFSSTIWQPLLGLMSLK
jgi:hypothetical protein